MSTPWIYNQKKDTLFILLPPFLIVGVVLLCQPFFSHLEDKYEFVNWLVFIVFIDVAHVYATLFKTYWVSGEVGKHRLRYWGIPLGCFVLGAVLYALGSKTFWSVLAYLAVFHFIRQQYGFMRLYSRTEHTSLLKRRWDTVMIYAVTGLPMLYWFITPDRNYTWFTPDDFWRLSLPNAKPYWCVFYILFWLVHITITFKEYQKFNQINWPKQMIIVGTAISWFTGIVYLNSDWAFTAINVVSHGVPYMALVYFNEIKSKPNELIIGQIPKQAIGVITFVIIICGFAFCEEWLWEVMVWKEHFIVSDLTTLNWTALWVPLLTVPQFTHYILDGIIWKQKKRAENSARST